MTKFLSVDPGGTTGYAFFLDGKLESVGEVQFDNFNKWLLSIEPVDLIVVENYRIRPPNMTGGKFAHQWDKGETLRLIGRFELYCEQKSIPLIKQEPMVKPQGYKLMGKEYIKGKKGMHIFDAVAHGHVFLGNRRNRDLLAGKGTSKG